MKKLFILILIVSSVFNAQDFTNETNGERNARMKWWRDARFGMFIHWGLYSIPAGEWNGSKNHGEWIRTTAQIPLEEYSRFTARFNPVNFNADDWVRMAKEAGMKYIVITSKHHDGFCLFESKQTEFDVMSTPFKRDILKELSDACRKYGLKICWYHSIMDWNHPDYLPRREWEKDRTADGADFSRFMQYLKNQLKELLTNYGEIGVLWFDGEWETTWNSEYGIELYNYVRSLQPDIIVNNRVGVGRSGMEGTTREGEFGGDFGTPEQQIPATGLPGVDWETCMTMNDHWGYNKNDNNFKSSRELIRMIADIASKGGNFLLNIGPTSEGLFPVESIERLKEIGGWMNRNGESIYGTEASPFANIEWGRATKKRIGANTRLYLHVFDWPNDGKLIIPGIYNKPVMSYLLGDKRKNLLPVQRNEDAIIVQLPQNAPDVNNSVVILDVEGKEDVSHPPVIVSDNFIFIESLAVRLKTERPNIEIRYTLDGSIPDQNSRLYTDGIELKESAEVSARCFRNGKPVSGTSRANFKRVLPEKSLSNIDPVSGISYKYFEGNWDSIPDFNSLVPVKEGYLENFNFEPRAEVEYFGFQYKGIISVPADDVYTFYTGSDDGSRLYINGKLVVDNDGLHGMKEEEGSIALSKGYHSILIEYFEKTGGDDLKISIEGGGFKKQIIPDQILYRDK